ncbi:MAG: hypothetical protein H0T44_15395 [Gemmatimonadales bacterium]|nr:hypothetical protein [Gemmatimonadales bacterium]
MRPRLTHLYPFLLALPRILNIVVDNPGEWSAGDLAAVLAAVLAACAVVYGVTVFLVRGRRLDQLPPLVTFAAVLWFYGYSATFNQIGPLLGPAPHLVLVAAGMLVTAGAIRWLSRRPGASERLGAFLTIVGAVIVVWQIVGTLRTIVRSRADLGQSQVIRRLSRPIGPAPTSTGSRPDIYLIVLDEYANSGELRERFGYDNTAFEDSLGRLGFVIPRSVRSNYAHTLLSIPSLLNASHLTDLTGELGAAATDPTVPNHLAEYNRSMRFLNARGYSIRFFPSLWWGATRRSELADVEYQPWRGFSLTRALSRSELRRTVRRLTALSLLPGHSAADAEYVRQTFAGLAGVPSVEAPTFTFAHVLSPHAPYVLDGDCQATELTRRRGAAQAGAYLDQLRCVNRLVLNLVTTLLTRSKEPPVILLQGDHGTSTLRYFSAPSAELIPPDAARERLGAFGAYYLPGAGATLPDTVTVVNVMGHVLRGYFGAELPSEPNDSYLSLEQSPYDLHRVTRLH